MAGCDQLIWTPPERLGELADCADTWANYENTKVHFAAGERSGTVRPDANIGTELPPLGALHVINAAQPDTDPASADNARRLELLDAEIAAQQLTALPTVGASFDDSYSEDGRAIFGLTDDEARALGLKFGQVAIFGWSGPRWSLIACATDRATHRGWTWGCNATSHSDVGRIIPTANVAPHSWA